MQIGDLVKRKPEWGEWVKHNPWMYTDKDLEIGVIIERVHIPGKRENKAFKILWPDGISESTWDHDLEKVDGNKNRGCSSPKQRQD